MHSSTTSYQKCCILAFFSFKVLLQSRSFKVHFFNFWGLGNFRTWEAEQRLFFIPFNLCSSHRRGDWPSKLYSALNLQAVNSQQVKDFSLNMHRKCLSGFAQLAQYVCRFAFWQVSFDECADRSPFYFTPSRQPASCTFQQGTVSEHAASHTPISGFPVFERWNILLWWGLSIPPLYSY